jgi:hypothetical protein
MRNFRVLENDIDVDAIFAMAQPAGFTDLTLKTICDREMTLAEHRILFGDGDPERLKADLWNETHNTMHNRAIFFLHKGPLRRDSRGHVGLAHTITIDALERVVGVGMPLRAGLTLHNTGDAHWLHRNSEIYGIVRVGTHLYDGGGRLLAVDHSRHDLPDAVAPGASLRMEIEVPLPAAGEYRIAFDLVAEGVTWFENVGSRPVEAVVRAV